MSAFTQFVSLCSSLTVIAAALSVFVRPVRVRLFRWAAEARQNRDGTKCLLRADMLRTYYRHREERQIRQYEYENFLMEYGAYKGMGGNSFVQKIYEEVKQWEVIT